MCAYIRCAYWRTRIFKIRSYYTRIHSSHISELNCTMIARLSSRSNVMLARQALEQPSCKEVDRLHIWAKRSLKPSDDTHRLKKKCSQSSSHSSQIPSIHLWMPCENTKWPQPPRIHLAEASHLRTKTTTGYDVEASKIRLKSVVQTRQEPTLSRHPFQSIPADQRPSYWSWIWTHQHNSITPCVHFKTSRDPTGHWEWQSIANPQECHSTQMARTPRSSAITDNTLLQYERQTNHTRWSYFP